MPLLFLLFMLCAFELHAQTLQELLMFGRADAASLAIKAQSSAKVAQSQRLDVYATPTLDLTLAHATEQTQEGVEYSVGFSQNLINPLDADLKSELVKSAKNALEFDEIFQLRQRERLIASHYYQTCSSAAILKESQDILDKSKERLELFEVAYALGEISKKELLFAKLEWLESRKVSGHYARVYEAAFAALQASVSEMELGTLACSDLLAPAPRPNIALLGEHSRVQSLRYDVQKAEAQERLLESPLPAVGYSLNYEEELFTERFKFGVSIPLGAATSYQGLRKEEAAQEKYAALYAKRALQSTLQMQQKYLLKRVQALYEAYALYEEEMLPLANELLEIVTFAFEEGEASAMEYIQSARSLRENSIEMLELRKAYYEELFKLYEVSDTSLGEKI